jgi:neutral ceramidase
VTHSRITGKAAALLALFSMALSCGLAYAQQAPPTPDLKILGMAPSPPGLARDGDLRAGAAVTDITPPKSAWNVMMAGYFNPQQTPVGVHDRLHAKALVLDNGQVRLCIVTTDLLSIPINLRNSTLAKLSRSAGLAPERILMCASHTHSGPGGLTQMKFAAQFLGAFRPDLADFVAARIARAIEAAAARLRPATLGYAAEDVSGFTHNRRGNKTINPRVAVIRVDGTDRKSIALLVNFGTHPVFLDEDNRLFSADFVGYMLGAIEARRGGVAMFANGAQGDQNPDQDEKLPTAYARAEAYGKRMAQEAMRIAARAPVRRQVALASVLGHLALPKPTVDVETRSAPIMAMRISDVLLLGVPGEPTAEIGLEIEKRTRQFGFELPIVIGLANDELAYILSREDYLRGEYEAKMSFYGPDLGPLMVAAMTDLASRIQPMSRAFGAAPATGSFARIAARDTTDGTCPDSRAR